jgi:hypothetical protein
MRETRSAARWVAFAIHTMAEDPNREVRTMVLLSLPYPPLPVLASTTEDGRLSGEQVTTSHTFIARGLDEAMARKDQKDNSERRERQLDVFRRFLHTMGTDGFFCNPDRLYQIYCASTLEHIATYFPPGHPVDIRFEPLASITRGDKAHSKMAEYMAAVSVLHEDAVPVPRSEYLQMSFADMLLACRDRLGHSMSEDERAAAQKKTEGA